MVFGVCRLIDLVVPDIPESLDIKIKRERFLAKEALQEAEHVLQKVLTGDQDVDSDRVDSSDVDSPLVRRRAAPGPSAMADPAGGAAGDKA